MEATHFIEVWKGFGGVLNDHACLPMWDFETQIEETRKSEFLETIAVWKIKPTDVPLRYRLAKRIGGNEGDMCGVEYFKKSLQLNAHVKKEFINAIIGV
jgi:hypothetical protein